MDPQRMVADLVQTRERRLFGFCIYGGEPCSGLSCSAHRDLLALDPNTYLMRLRSTAPAAPEGTGA